ncbi:MAG: response regulator [Clostridiales bacterium]|jgi:signal transduction histidine kinase/DNA-binding response OmpR family regulator/HPt (histidine-containing phosphotransfer) domain-containing protein|nr:response regulator [Clostridiales bacterium]
MGAFTGGKLNLLLIIILFAILLAAQNFLILHQVRGMSGDAHVVNYSGLVRGATQRLVKLELSRQPNDELMALLEEYIYGLAGYQNNYKIVYMEYEPFQTSINELIVIWKELKTAIYNYRAGKMPAEVLLEVSERHFQKADEATHNAEYGSEGKVRYTDMLIKAGMVATAVIVIIVAFLAVALRRSQRRQMQVLREKNRELEAAVLEANEANRAKSTFLSNMSHDIRTPLNGVIGMTNIAFKNLRNPEKMRDCLRKIENSSKHLQSLINDVLDMSKIESGKFFLNNGEIYLPEFMRDLINITGQQIRSKKHEFNVSVFSVTNENIIADRLRLNQLFVNLVSNAVKFTPYGGKISFIIRQLSSSKEGCARFEFICRDSGIGMSEEFMQHLFDSFSRERDSRIDKIEGSGLGLTITKRIVDLMGGEIRVKSEKNKGTEFTVTLEFAAGGDIPIPETLNGVRVLLADTDTDVCADSASVLEKMGVYVSAKSDLREIASLLKSGEKYDIFIVNRMHIKEGYDVCELFKEKMGENAPVILSSVWDRSDMEHDMSLAKATGFIQKPFFRSVLFSKISEVLFGKRDKTNFSPNGGGMRLDGIRILMAEDNELNTEIAVEMLTSSGILLDCAVNGKEALEIFEASEPSAYAVILMDMQMPVMSGCEAASAIRKSPHPDALTIPIIAMTANAFEEDVREAFNAGMNAHVAKPVNFENLKTVVSSFLPDREEEHRQTDMPPQQARSTLEPNPLEDSLNPYGINVPAGVKRFGGNKNTYERILFKFPMDNNFDQLLEAMRLEKFEVAAKAAHALKGVSANLSIESLAQEVSKLEQALKQGNNELAAEILEKQVRGLYENVSRAIADYSSKQKRSE